MQLATSTTVPEDRVQTILRDLAAGASVEVVPRQVVERPLASLFPRGSRIYVPYLPKADFFDTVAACEHLLAQGLQPIPHLPARAVASAAQLRDWLFALSETGVDSLLLIAGDKPIAGPYPDTLAVLETGMLEAFGIANLGIAGHPEGHPQADQAELDRALDAKIAYGRATGTHMWIVSQFAFASDRVLAWVERLGDRGCELPIHVGMPGPTSLTRLLAYAAQCGVDASARVFMRRPGAARLLGRWTADGLVRDLARHRITHPDSPLRGIHLFSFGGVDQAARWLGDLQPRSAGVTDLAPSGVAE